MKHTHSPISIGLFCISLKFAHTSHCVAFDILTIQEQVQLKKKRVQKAVKKNGHSSSGQKNYSK